VQPADVHGHPLHHQSGALSDGFISPGRQLIEKLLMTKDQPSWTRRLELTCEKSGLAQTLILARCLAQRGVG
jgi:hypothetical protein